MVYQPDDPDLGPTHNIQLIAQHAQHIPIYESLRHNRPAPAPPSPSLSSHQTKTYPKAPLSLNQQVVRPPTDAECGLPDLYTTTLSTIPKPYLPLSKYLSRAPLTTILHGYARSEFAVSLAHALNLRRCSGGARAVLILTSSESAVREWIAALCPVLDEVQVISYSKGKLKRDATLVRLRKTQFPGVVVAVEKVARDAISEIWGALRENRLIRKWEFVVSEAVTDANVEGVCSPLRMVREGTTECGLVLGKKGLSRVKAIGVVGGIDSVNMDSFWVRKKDVPSLVEQFEKHDEGAGKKVRPSAEGKENRASLRNRDIVDADKGKTKERQASQGPVTVKRRSNSGVVKPAKEKEHSLRATTRLPRAVISRGRSTSDDGVKLASGTDSSTDLRRSSRIPVKGTSGDAKPDGEHSEQTGRATVGPIKRRKPYNRIAPELLSQTQRPRRRSPRFSPPPTDESSPVPRIEVQPKQRRSTKSQSIQEPVAVMPLKVKRDNPRSRGSSSGSVVLSRTEMTNEDQGNTTSSRGNLENVQKRARSLGIYDTSSEETFYTPPSHALSPKSSSPSSDKYHTPRSSLSPKAVADSSKPRKNSLLKIVSRKGSSSRSHERERAMSTPTRYVPPKAKATPLKIDGSRRNKRLGFGDSDSSDDEPLSTKFAGRRKEGNRCRSNIYLSPALSRKKVAVQTTGESAKRKQPVKRRSVFEGLVPRNFEPSQKSDGVTRRHSLSGPVRVKHEADLVSPLGNPRYSVTAAKIRRKSFHNVMKREDDVFNRDTPLPEGMPRCSNIGKQSRRSPLPSTSSIRKYIPSKRPSLENRSTHAVPRSLSRDTSSASRARRASLGELRRRSTPSYKAQNTGLGSIGGRSRSEIRIPSRSPVRNPGPQYRGQNTGLASKARRSHSELGLPSRSPVRSTAPNTSPVPPEVVIIISDSEEETIRNVTPTKRRRLFANAENRQDTPRNETIAGTSSRRNQDQNGESRSGIRRNATETGRSSKRRTHGQNGESRRSTRRNDKGAGTSSRRAPGQNRTEPSDRAQVRSSRSLRDMHASQEETLGTFIRNVNRRGKLSQLTALQRKKYDEHLNRATRYREMDRPEEAIESYEKCLEIYDGDPELTNWLLALSSHQGYLRTSDFSARRARSPIKKQPRRRRNPGRTARGERIRSRTEIIDLTSS